MFDGLEAIVSGMTEALYVLDTEWRFTFLNQSAERLMQRKREDVLGQSLWEQFPHAVDSVFFREYHRAVAQGHPVAFEGYCELSCKWYKVQAFPFERGLSVLLHDITVDVQGRRMTEVINNITLAIHSTLDFDEVMKRLVVEVARGLDCQATAIGLLAEEGLRLTYSHNCSPDIMDKIVPYHEIPYLQKVMQQKQGMLIHASQLPDGLGDRLLREMGGLETILVIPLHNRQEVLGALFLSSPAPAVVISKQQMDFGNQVATAVAISLANVQLYQQVQQQGCKAETERQRLRAVLDALPVGVAVFDKEGCVVRSNVIMDRLWGGSQAELVLFDDNTSYRTWHTQSGCPVNLQEWGVSKALEGVTTWHQALEFICADGSKAALLCSAAPIRDGNGEVIGAVSVAQDMAEVKQAREKLEELVRERTEYLEMANERFTVAFACSPSIMAIHDLDGRFVDVNESFQCVTGWSKAEVLGRTTVDIGINDQLTPEIFKRIFQNTGRVENLDIHFVTRTGQQREGLLSAERIYLNGQELILTLVHDITDRIMLHQEIDRFDRMKLVGQMAASFAHEIRNPMATVRGFMQFLQKKTESEQHKGYFDLVISELDRTNDIINGYLALARDKHIDRRKVNLNNIIQTILPLIQSDGLAEDKTVIFEPGELPEFLLDDKEIVQLIINLCRNGLQAMDQEGTLLIRTWCDGAEAVLSVADAGPGIAPEVQDKLFIPFVTTKENGSGLGLTVCHNIVERHKGRIEYTTGPTGTVFFIRFPLATAAAAS